MGIESLKNLCEAGELFRYLGVLSIDTSLSILYAVLKTEGFYTSEPQEGAANSSQGKPCA